MPSCGTVEAAHPTAVRPCHHERHPNDQPDARRTSAGGDRRASHRDGTHVPLEDVSIEGELGAVDNRAADRSETHPG
ncbi:hypothetical protein ACFQGT_14905 [Natrialbaceae archaeon GCM10025810]|uniref:hypothetical protein n=1 Tax=Halovalidus salilacus TaxID=3075124 RepID=UPI00361BEFBD